MKEIVAETKTVEALEASGWLVRKVVYTGRRGSPDRWCLKMGTWVLIEFKAVGEKPTAQQQREHDRLRGHGQRVYIIDNVPAGLALVEQLNAEVEGEQARRRRLLASA